MPDIGEDGGGAGKDGWGDVGGTKGVSRAGKAVDGMRNRINLLF